MRMPWAAEARLARSEKGLSSALAGEQTLGDGFGLVTSHMFGGAVVGGGGNVALHANSGDKVNGTANYGSAFVSGAIGGAVAGGAAGVYRARGAKKFSEARVARATERHEKAMQRVADKNAPGFGGAMAIEAQTLVNADRMRDGTQLWKRNTKDYFKAPPSYGQGGVSAGAGFNGIVPQTNLGSGVKTSTGTSAVNPISSGAGVGTSRKQRTSGVGLQGQLDLLGGSGSPQKRTVPTQGKLFKPHYKNYRAPIKKQDEFDFDAPGTQRSLF